MRGNISSRVFVFLLLVSGPCLSWGIDFGGIFGSKRSEKPMIGQVESGSFRVSSLAKETSLDLEYLRTEGLGLMPDFQVQQYANKILNKLLSAAQVTDYGGRVYIRVAAEYGAFATAGGNIAINLGTLRDLETEDEIAAVIAHELSHVLLHHHDSDAFLEFQKTIETTAEWAAILKAVADHMGKTGVVNISQQSTEALSQIKLVVALSEIVISPAWNRSQESDADLLGFDLLIKAGYDGNALLNVVEKERQYEDLVKERRDESSRNISQQGNLSHIVQDGLTSLVSAFSTKHPEAKLRQQELAAYMSQHYPEHEGGKQDAAGWDRIKSERNTLAILRNYEYALKAHKLLDVNDPQASGYASKAISGPTATHPYPLYIASLTLEKSGRLQDATKLMESAIRSSKSTALLYLHTADLYEKSGKPAMALKIADSGYKESRSAPKFLPVLIRLNKKNGNSNLAFEKNLECGLKYPNLKDDCQRAAAL